MWGAPRIHGELLKLGFEIAESTVSEYMIRQWRPPSQTWRTFLRNHADAIAAIDLCLVPTLTFESLFAFLVVGKETRSSFSKPPLTPLESPQRPQEIDSSKGRPIHVREVEFAENTLP